MEAARAVANKAFQTFVPVALAPMAMKTQPSESWSNLFMVEDHGSSVMALLSKQRTEDTDLCDIRLVSSDNEAYPCHRAVLASQSVFMDNLIKEDRPAFGDEIRLPQRGEDLVQLLNYMYTGTMDISERNCWRLYSTVCFFRMQDQKIRDEVFTVVVKLLQDEDEDFLKSDDFFNIELRDMPRVVDVLMQAACAISQEQQILVLEALGKWANRDLLRRGQFFLEVDQRYQLSLNLGE